MKTLSSISLSLSLSLVAMATPNWPTQRGPHFNGTAGEGMKLPAKFSPTENVVWKAQVPGSSAATPVVWGDYVFVTAADHEKKE
ncbi:PQQ-binding-like beta-propeller repeat protein, partial [Akkermansiaceae bacterium]|nr:PQQ-binding-like beta-propeller repeat protein [Akkermansiaceae bacterium]